MVGMNDIKNWRSVSPRAFAHPPVLLTILSPHADSSSYRAENATTDSFQGFAARQDCLSVGPEEAWTINLAEQGALCRQAVKDRPGGKRVGVHHVVATGVSGGNLMV